MKMLQRQLASLTDHWYSKNIFSYLLWPLSLCYQMIVGFRKFFYRLELLKSTKFPVPVLVVGNINVGGTGKTPLVIWLAKYLQAQGYKPGIVSRGYGSKSKSYPHWVQEHQDAHQVGDEALLLAANTHCPIVIDANRPRAVASLLKDGNCNVVISDDGMQHYALGRQIEIAVIDGERRFGNGLCLPAGPLREPHKRLTNVDFVVCTGAGQGREHSMRLLPGSFVSLVDTKQQATVMDFYSKKIYAVAGIGNPARFFTLLNTLNLKFTAHPFPDHYKFSSRDFEHFEQDGVILMTEKDAVKCKKFADGRYWYLPVYADLPEKFGEELLQKLKAVTL